MVRHIVMWKFKPECGEQAQEFLARLAALGDQIEAIAHMQVEQDCSGKDSNFDAVLISDFNSFEDLNTYLNDPRHVSVSSLCKDIRISRAAVDFTV